MDLVTAMTFKKIMQYITLKYAYIVIMEIAAGFAVGVSETLVGYPFMTAKVLAQNAKPWWGHSVRRYYQGVKYPLVSSTGFNTLVFPCVHHLQPHTQSYALSGAIAGCLVAPQMWFVDTFTIRRQTNQNVSLRMFRGAKGFGMTAARESLALSAYFSTYYMFRDDCGSFVAGGLAGLSNWTLSFPLDTLRTRQIAQRCTVREAWRQKHLWHGFTIAAARAVIVNAASFTVYEKSLVLLRFIFRDVG